MFCTLGQTYFSVWNIGKTQTRTENIELPQSFPKSFIVWFVLALLYLWCQNIVTGRWMFECWSTYLYIYLKGCLLLSMEIYQLFHPLSHISHLGDGPVTFNTAFVTAGLYIRPTTYTHMSILTVYSLRDVGAQLAQVPAHSYTLGTKAIGQTLA